MPLRLAVLLLALGLSAPVTAQTSSAIDREALAALSVVPDEAEGAIGRLLLIDDPATVPVLVRLLRWAPDDRERLVARLDQLTRAHPGDTWFDWTAWLQDHSEFRAPPGFAAFLTKLLTDVDPQFARFIGPEVAHDIRLEEVV